MGLDSRILEVHDGLAERDAADYVDEINRYAFWMDTARIFGSIQPPSCMCNQFIPFWRDSKLGEHRRWRWKASPSLFL